MAIYIHNKKYEIIDVPFGLRNKLIETFNRNVKLKEIVDNKKITNELFGNDLKNIKKTVVHNFRYYVIDVLTQRMKKLLNTPIKHIGDQTTQITFFDIIKQLYRGSGIRVFIKGGAVRDAFFNIDNIDIDAVFTSSNVLDIKKICDNEKWYCDNVMPQYQYINIGGEKGASIDLTKIDYVLKDNIYNHEFTISDLMFDPMTNILIDVSGFGLFDVINKMIRLSVEPDLYYSWAMADYKKPLRYFKLIMKGYKPINTFLNKFIVKFIEKHYENTYEQPLYKGSNISKIKNFLIVNITSGTINSDGTFNYGVNKRVIAPYLMTLKQHLNRDIFRKIIDNLHADSHDKYLTKITATIRKTLDMETKEMKSISKVSSSIKTKMTKIKKIKKSSKIKKAKTAIHSSSVLENKYDIEPVKNSLENNKDFQD